MWIWYILGAVIALVALCEVSTWKTGVPTLASFPPARWTIHKILREAFERGDLPRDVSILDLGSGNGQLAASLARAFPDSRVTGIEISWVPWALSVLRQRLLGLKNLDFARGDFWPYECARFGVVVTYLTGNVIEKVGEKLRRELKSGAWVIANDTALRGDWVPFATRATGLFGMKVYVYRQEGRD